MKFVDRTTERSFMRGLINEIMDGKQICIWIEGTSGSGKSYFVKYLNNESELPVYTFENSNWLYKCNESDIDNAYQFFVEIINDFQQKYPKKFNDYLVKYFKNLYDISWIETLGRIMPNIKFTKWAKDAVKKPLEQIEQAKSNVSSMLYNSGLRKFLAQCAIYYLRDLEHKKNVVFFLDDACWLDQNSIATIKLMLNLIMQNRANFINVSFVILTRPKNELSAGKENYSLLENDLKDIYGDIKYIKIKNFDYQATLEYIKLMDRDYIQEVTYNLFKKTSGNPQELFQSLKFDDVHLAEITQSSNNENETNYMSAELLIRLASHNSYCFPIICSISMLHQEMKYSWLILITKSFCNRIINEKFNSTKFDNCLKILKSYNIINLNMDTVEIVHDSVKEIAINYIKYNGEYNIYMDCLTETLINFQGNKNIFIKEIMHLYSEYNPKRCFDFFVEYYDKIKLDLNDIIIKLVAESLSVEKSLYTIKNITTYIIPVILDNCIKLSYYDFGYKICVLISDHTKDLSSKILFKYYIYFAKILIDKGLLQKNEKFNAITAIENAEKLSDLNANEELEICILAMSAYEHLIDYDNINKYNINAQKIVENKDVNILFNSMYLRNQGLVKSHSKLKSEYMKSIEYSEQIDNMYEKYLMLGTCHNNLGLHYLYTNDVNSALAHFEIAQMNLEKIGYDVFRVLNNIAICKCILGNREIAYNYLLQSKNLNLNCIFEKLCIQNNIALLEYKLGNKEDAKAMLIKIIDEYKEGTKQTNDDLVYSSAMVNLAYFYFLEGKFIESGNLYKESKFFKYRYDDDLQKKKRQYMLELNMYKLEMGQMPEDFIDINDTGTNIFKKMYSFIPFAYYII